MNDSDQRKVIQNLAKELDRFPINESIPYAKPVKTMPRPEEYDGARGIILSKKRATMMLRWAILKGWIRAD